MGKTKVIAAVFVIFQILLFSGCNRGKTEQQAGQEGTAGAGVRKGASEGEVSLFAVERSQPVEGAQVDILSPQPGAVLPEGDSTVAFEVADFELGARTETPRAQSLANSEQGQHVHVIVDNNPYFACYASPCTIGRLDPGAHTLVAFPSRSYHESIKSGNAADVFNFHVGRKDGEFLLDTAQPAIIYSRPKGTYSGAGADSILLDFYLHKVELSEGGYRARYTISPVGDEFPGGPRTLTLAEWRPALVTGLSEGRYEVTLELIGPGGEVVPGAFNRTTRTITVQRGAEVADAHGGH